MASYTGTIGLTRHRFDSLGALMAAASPHRSGDDLAGVSARSAEERVAARFALADLPLDTFLQDLLIPYEDDEVTRLIIDEHDQQAFRQLSHLTVGGLRDWLLSPDATTEHLRTVARAITPEMAAAVSKLMRNQDLIAVARKCIVVTAFRTTIGLPGTLASRLQPNHPADSQRGIMASVLDGLAHASGDAVIGINPATDSLDNCHSLLDMLDGLRERFAIPMQSCVLTHVSSTIQLVERGAPVDLVFQSIAGTEAANKSFGISLAMLREAHEAGQSLNRGTIGTNLMYFETGQGSALSSGAHHNLDQQTVEVRAYAVARAYAPLLVNTVAGFIGPEYLADGKQIIRAGLEDVFCGKLLGLPMGCDVCYTNHADADQNDSDILATLLGVAGANFLIAVPGADDIMLGYQSLSFQDILYLRSVLGLGWAPEFETWLRARSIIEAGAEPRLAERGNPAVLTASTGGQRHG